MGKDASHESVLSPRTSHIFERKVGLAIACLLGTDDGIRPAVFCLEHGATAKRELGIGMIPDGDVEHGFVFTKLHLVDIKLESLRFVTIAWIGPNLLCSPVDGGEQEQYGDGMLVHCLFCITSIITDNR